MKPRLLDLFCGAGGAAMGYSRAGFDVVGVDIKPQPNYPFEFEQADALAFVRNGLHGRPHDIWGRGFDAVHASPPCQAYTAYKRTGNVGDYPDLIAPVRELLQATGLPYVIENVVGAPLHDPVLICGTMFDPPMEVQRHRLFEANWALEPPVWPCRHLLNGPRFPASTNRARMSRRTLAVGQWNTPLELQRQAMGIDWMTLDELSEAIPPAYTEFIGAQLLARLQAQRDLLDEIREEHWTS